MRKKTFDKHALYLASVQDPLGDVDRISRIYETIFDRFPLSLREDFSGTFALSCCWIQSNGKRTAVAIDNDKETIKYGIDNYLGSMSSNEQARIKPVLGDAIVVTDKVDIVATFNFSYCLLHDRTNLLNYFQCVNNSLNTSGMIILDIFGGSESEVIEIQERDIDGNDQIEPFLFEFERVDFNPITRISNYAIHFKYSDGQILENAFSYEFRMWSIPEINDLLIEAGFSSVKVFWEKCDEDGFGNGEFYETLCEENSVNWNAYIVGVK